MNSEQVEITLLLMMVATERDPPKEAHETLLKDLSLPFMPFPGMTLRFDSTRERNKEGVPVKKRIFGPVLTLSIKVDDISFNISKGSLTIACHRSFRSLAAFSQAIEELTSDFGFR